MLSTYDSQTTGWRDLDSTELRGKTAAGAASTAVWNKRSPEDLGEPP